MKIRYAIFLLLFCIVLPVYAEHKHLSVTFISPNPNDNDFWGSVHSFGRQSAKDLDIDFNIAYNSRDDRYSYLEIFKDVISSEDRPDFIVAVFFRKISLEMIKLSKQYKVPLFMVNTDASNEDKDLIGKPREHYKNYIGLIAPNEETAGYLLAKELIKEAKSKNPKKTITVVGISGRRDGPETVRRNNGLKRAVQETGAKLYQIVYADWNKDIAYSHSKKLMKRYNDLDVIWCASDLMAIYTKKAIDENKKHIFTGGIDWTKDGIKAVKSGTLVASVGGHFSDVGIALVLLYDYFYGKDFSDDLGLHIDTKMSLISKDNINKYYNTLTTENWSHIDFTRLSKVKNKDLKEYDFSFDNLFNVKEVRKR
jgi:ABC-type sugar transport system substrate-binding protein